MAAGFSLQIDAGVVVFFPIFELWFSYISIFIYENYINYIFRPLQHLFNPPQFGMGKAETFIHLTFISVLPIIKKNLQQVKHLNWQKLTV